MSARVSDKQLNGQVMVNAGIGYPEFQALPPVLHSLLDLQELRAAARKVHCCFGELGRLRVAIGLLTELLPEE